MTDTAVATQEAAPAMPAPTKADAVKWIVDETRAGREPTAAAVQERFSVSPRTATNYRSAAREVLDAGAPVVPIRPTAPARPEPRKPASATPPPVADHAPRPPEVPSARNGDAPATRAGNPPPATSRVADRQPARADRQPATVPPASLPAPAHAPAGASPAVVKATTVAVVAVALVAAVVSYEHMRLLAESAGESWWRAALLPLSVDGLVIVASAVMLTRRRSGKPGGKLAGFALVLGIVASLAANVVSADPTLVPVHVVRWAVAGWSPLSLAVAFELLLQLRAERSPGPDSDGDCHSFTGSQHRSDAGDPPVTRHRSGTNGQGKA